MQRIATLTVAAFKDANQSALSGANYDSAKALTLGPITLAALLKVALCAANRVDANLGSNYFIGARSGSV
jgi:hypothetical protein